MDIRLRLIALLACTMLTILPRSHSAPLQSAAHSSTFPASAPTSPSAPAIPLPHSSGGGLPPGAPSIVGYVYLDGQPRAGAKVTIASARGMTETWTISQANNAQPYYSVVLGNTSSAAIRGGETITITAEYGAHSRMLKTQVLSDAQQIDVVLPRTYDDDYVIRSQIPPQSAAPPSISDGLTFPTGIVTDQRGAVYVVDWGNARVQAFNRRGGLLRQTWGSFGSQQGNLAGPQGIAMDASGNFYVADTFNYRIQKFTSTGNLLAAWGSPGTGNGEFNGPFGIAVDRVGNVYVGDYLNHRIQKFAGDGTYLTQWGSQGTGLGAFNYPAGIATDNQNNVYVADRENNRIQKFSSAGAYLATWPSGSANYQLDKPQGIALDSAGNMLVTDWGNHRVVKLGSDGAYLTAWDITDVPQRALSGPWGIAVDQADNDTVYVVDNAAHQVQKYSSAGVPLGSFGRRAGEDGPLITPVGVALDGDGQVYVTEWEASRIRIFNANNEAVATWSRDSTNPNRDFDHPTGIAVDSGGNIYVADTGTSKDLTHQRILKFNSSGVLQQIIGGFGVSNGQFIAPTGIALDTQGNIYVVDYGVVISGVGYGHRVQKFDRAGHFLKSWGAYGNGNGQFIHPIAVAIGPDGTVYVTDSGNNRIQLFTSEGGYVGQWRSQGSGNGEIAGPSGITVDSGSNVYVAEGGDVFGTAHYTNYRVQKFTNAGSLIASWGSPGGAEGQFINPLGVVVDQQGDVYVADSRNNRVQRFARMAYTRPIATLVQVPEHIEIGQPLTVYGAGSDSDTTQAVEAFEWTLSTSVSGTLTQLTTTTMSTTLDTSHLSVGQYALTLRVRDTEGEFSEPQTTKFNVGQADTWTFLLYLDADSNRDGSPEQNLARYLSMDSTDGALYRLQNASPNAHVRIAALYDGPGSGDSSYYLSDANGHLNQAAPPITGTTEVNMGDPQTLIDFVTWGQQAAPATHYYLAIADHANGTEGIAWDYTSAPDGSAHLTNATLLQALASVTKNKQRIDVLHLDGCLMGLAETAYELRDTVQYLVSSENLAWSVFAYSDYRDAIDGTTTPADFAKAIVQRYANAVGNQSKPITIAAIGMDSPLGPAARMNDLADKTNVLAVALRRFARASEENRSTLTRLRNDQVQKFDSNGDYAITGDDNYVDLFHWAELVQGLPDPQIQSAALDVQTALRSLVLLQSVSGEQVANAHGVSIYFPSRASLQSYTAHDFDFLARVQWGEFLTDVLDPSGASAVGDAFNPIPPLEVPRAATPTSSPIPSPTPAPSPTASPSPTKAPVGSPRFVVLLPVVQR